MVDTSGKCVSLPSCVEVAQSPHALLRNHQTEAPEEWGPLRLKGEGKRKILRWRSLFWGVLMLARFDKKDRYFLDLKNNSLLFETHRVIQSNRVALSYTRDSVMAFTVSLAPSVAGERSLITPMCRPRLFNWGFRIGLQKLCLSSVHPMSSSWHNIGCTEDKHNFWRPIWDPQLKGQGLPMCHYFRQRRLNGSMDERWGNTLSAGLCKTFEWEVIVSHDSNLCMSGDHSSLKSVARSKTVLYVYCPVLREPIREWLCRCRICRSYRSLNGTTTVVTRPLLCTALRWMKAGAFKNFTIHYISDMVTW